MSTPRPFVLGVDPGYTGALAIVSLETLELEWVGDMPVAGSGPHKRVNSGQLAIMLDGWAQKLEAAYIERAQAHPADGKDKLFRYALGAGVLEGVLSGLAMVPIRKVAPSVWKASMGLTASKIDSLSKARRSWPYAAEAFFDRKKDHGRAEAALLALYGARRLRAVRASVVN